MTLYKCLSIALTLLMFNPIWVTPLFAQPRGGWKKYSPDQLRAAVGVLGTGQEARVTVKLRDKTTFSGYLSQAEPTRFLVREDQTRKVIPVSYGNVKELRAENTENGVQFAARVSLSALQLDVDGDTSTLSPGNDCCHPKGEWIAFVVGMGFLALMLALLASDKS
jgi:hypothetical protein